MKTNGTHKWWTQPQPRPNVEARVHVSRHAFRDADAAHAAFFTAQEETHEETHNVIIVQRPFDQVRPICSCGWQGTTCRSVADAEIEGNEHIKN